MQLVEELHLARSQRRLEVNVVESYGELTCMDIDQPEEGANVAFSKSDLHKSHTTFYMFHLHASLKLGKQLSPSVIVTHKELEDIRICPSVTALSRILGV